MERVKGVFRDAPAGDAAALCAFILNSVAKFEDESSSRDDRTALSLVRTA
jgi:hypothetical protein